MFEEKLRLTKPGLFVTATDTAVGKTVVTCAIAAALQRQRPGVKVGVCKPFASGCRREREGLVSEDGEALAHFANAGQPLDVVTPLRFTPPLAPGPAAESAGRGIDDAPLRRALERLDRECDVLLIEGVGGLFVPLDPGKAKVNVLDLIAWLGLPAIVVARPGLGTLNHTAMTAALLKQRKGVRVAGLVVNGYEGDTALDADPSIESNRRWMTKMTGLPLLATLPKVAPQRAAPEKGVLDEAVLEAAEAVDWSALLATAKG